MEKSEDVRFSEMAFEQLSELAQADPEAFEKMRVAAIEEFFQSVPAGQRQRLRRLQWRIDQERRLASNPLAACLRISGMMWDAFAGEDGLLTQIRELASPARDSRSLRSRRSGVVLQFCRPGE